MSSYTEFLDIDVICSSSNEEIMEIFNICIDVIKKSTRFLDDVKKIEEFAKTGRDSEFKRKLLIQFISNAQFFESYAVVLKQRIPAKFQLKTT